VADPNRVMAFGALPDPGTAGSVDELVELLRRLKIWAGNPSYDTIRDRVNAAWRAAGRPPGELARRGTVVDCFKSGRRRLNADLVLAVVKTLQPDEGYVAQWRQALRVVGGETRAADQVRAQAMLPADLADFTGRSAELEQLRHALRRGRDTGGTGAISAIEGMAGVGKTQLAIHAGHQLARESPFGRILFVNLRGFHPDPAQPPVNPSAVLDSFLRLLGVPGQQIPHDLAARTALYRERLAGLRALVVLDNAADERQVLPLLPDGSNNCVLITSRRRLSDLPGVVTHLSVDVFTPDEALDFLKRATPDVPVGDDPEALARVARRCGHLPLALSLIAAHMRAREGWTVTDHADRLDERYGGNRLDGNVDVALAVSYRHLPAGRRRQLRLLALHPGDDFDTHAAAALVDADLAAARDGLGLLCRDHLLQQAGPDRYVFHDLVRAYASDRASDEERPPERRAAVTRLLDHYLYAAASALNTLFPAERHRRPDVAEPASRTPAVDDPEAARNWLATERANLVAAAVHAVEGWPEHTTRMAMILFRYLDTQGHYRDAVTIHTSAVEAARHSGDRAAEAHALINLGSTYWLRGRYPQAADQLQQALALSREVGDRLAEGRASTNLGLVRWQLGDYQQAADHHRRALALARELGNRYGEGLVLNNLGAVYERLGRYREAVDQHEQALAVFRDIGDLFGEANTLDNLSIVRARLGEAERAIDEHQLALAIFRKIGNRSGEGCALNTMGMIYQALGSYRQAADEHRQALEVFREIGDRGGETEALNGLGESLCADGAPDVARVQHRTALMLATDIGDRYEQARAHDGLGRTYRPTQPRRARQHWLEALARYVALGVPEAESVRRRLATLGETTTASPPLDEVTG
jgi:tetratricopeptide (TPR) repeat protein